MKISRLFSGDELIKSICFSKDFSMFCLESKQGMQYSVYDFDTIGLETGKMSVKDIAVSGAGIIYDRKIIEEGNMKKELAKQIGKIMRKEHVFSFHEHADEFRCRIRSLRSEDGETYEAIDIILKTLEE